MLLLSAKKNEELIYYDKQTDSIYLIPFDQKSGNWFKAPYVFAVEMLCVLVATIGVWTNYLVFAAVDIANIVFVVILVCDYEKRNNVEVLEKIKDSGIKIASLQLKKINWLRERMCFLSYYPYNYIHNRRIGFCALGLSIPFITLILSPNQIYEGIIVSIALSELLLYFLWTYGDLGRWRFKRKLNRLKKELSGQ